MTSAGRWLPGREAVEGSEWSLAHCSQPSNPLALPDPSSFAFPSTVQRSGRSQGRTFCSVREAPTTPPISQAQSVPASWGVVTILRREEMQNSQAFFRQDTNIIYLTSRGMPRVCHTRAGSPNFLFHSGHLLLAKMWIITKAGRRHTIFSTFVYA